MKTLSFMFFYTYSSVLTPHPDLEILGGKAQYKVNKLESNKRRFSDFLLKCQQIHILHDGKKEEKVFADTLVGSQFLSSKIIVLLEVL